MGDNQENAQSGHIDGTSTSGTESNKIFIGGLSWDTTEEGLRNHFGKFGNVVDCVVMKDPGTMRSRGFGFVTFSAEEGRQATMNNAPHTLDGRTVEVKRAQPKGERGGMRTKKIFVGGIAQTTTEDTIRKYFSQYGKIEEVLLMKDRNTDRPRGFGFVSFDSEDVVDSLCQRRWHDIDSKQVEIKKAEPRGSDRMGGMGGGMYRGGMAYGGGYHDDSAGRGPREGGYGGGYGAAYGSGYSGGYGQGGYAQGGYGGGRDGYGAQGGYQSGGYGGGAELSSGYGQRGYQEGGYSSGGYGSQGGVGGGAQGSYGGGSGYDNYGGYGMGQYGPQVPSNYGPSGGSASGSGGYSNRSYHPYGR